MLRITLLLALLLNAISVMAAPGEQPSSVPPPVDEQAELEPEVTIVRKDDETVEEYRINGKLYMIKVIPNKGPEYFLIDSDGNGSLDERRSEIDPKLMIPSWTILKW